MDDLTFYTMLNVLQSGMWLLNDLEEYLRPMNMSQARLSILISLRESENGSISPKEIARNTGKSKPAITRTIYKLSNEGYISISQDKNDLRCKKLNLTKEGRKLLSRIIPEYNLRIEKMSSLLSEDDKNQLNRLLGKINFLDKEKELKWKT